MPLLLELIFFVVVGVDCLHMFYKKGLLFLLSFSVPGVYLRLMSHDLPLIIFTILLWAYNLIGSPWVILKREFTCSLVLCLSSNSCALPSKRLCIFIAPALSSCLLKVAYLRSCKSFSTFKSHTFGNWSPKNSLRVPVITPSTLETSMKNGDVVILQRLLLWPC